MRNWALVCVAIMTGDLVIFWLLKQLGVFSIGEIPPTWVKVAFLVPLYASAVIFMSILLFGAKIGIVYDSMGGRKILFKENPFYFLVVFVINLSACILMFVGLTIVLLNNGT